MSKILGIDLGTTNSCMAVVEGGEPVVIPNAEGNRTTPSVVAFSKTGEELVGQIAKRQAVTNPTQTIFSAKRFIGRRYDEVQHEIDLVPYEIVKAENGDAHIKVGDKVYSPPQISAKILQKLKADAEAYLGETITEAVITVPAYFNDSQRQATKDAGKIAGLEVKRIINEPTAAALAYGSDKKTKGDRNICVYDLGGGTFDVSVLELSEGLFEVKATNGDTHLGGDDFDEVIIEYLVSDFKKEHNIDLRQDPTALQRLKEAAEKAKCELSSAQSTDINLPFIAHDSTGAKNLMVNLSRAKFEELSSSLVDRSLIPVRSCMDDSDLSTNEIHEVILVGGQTRMVKVAQAVKDYFGKEASKGVNPDEVVALGAAIQGGVFTGDVDNVVLLDVTPLSLGIEANGGIFAKMIERNTTIPFKKEQEYSTAADNQTAVDIRVLQGERELASHNKLIGDFRLDGIRPAPRGVPRIQVTFDIDANGILNVSAKDQDTGKEQKIEIKASSGLSEEEVERMVQEAAANASADKKQKENIELKNQAESLCYQVEKEIKEHGSKLPDDLTKPLEKEVAELKKEVDASNFDKIKSLFDAINPKVQAFMTEVAKIKQADTAQGASPQANKADEKEDDVIEADFEVEEDSK